MPSYEIHDCAVSGSIAGGGYIIRPAPSRWIAEAT